MKFVLTCCSTADMSRDYFEKRNIPFIMFHFVMDGKTYNDDLGKTIPMDKFYQMIADGATPTTSQPNAEDLVAVWEPFLKEGKDILHLELSSGISGAINSANIARDLMLDKYPDRKILVSDTLCASSGYGLIVDDAADLRDQDKSIEEVYQYVEDNKLYVNHWFFSTDLTSFLRGGRISNVEHFFGNMFGICPLMNVDYQGKLIPRYKVRTKKKVIVAMVDKMKELVQDGADYDGKCFLSNSACKEDAEKVIALIEENMPKLKGKIILNDIGTVIGSHTGPGTVALFFKGKKRED